MGFKECCALALLGALAWPAMAAVPEEWRTSAYAYEASQTPLETVLRDFANAYGVGLKLSGVSGVVDAKLRAANAQEFLDRLALEHQFQWFFYNGQLYVSPQSTQVSQRLEVSADAAPDLKQALTDIGLLDKRFGWGELPDEGVVLISGPSRYVEFVRGFSQQKVKPEEKQQVMMFPLRYAAVADRQIRYRDQSMTLAGVATLLEGLLDKTPQQPSPQDPMANIEAMQGMADMARTKIFNLANARKTSPGNSRPAKTGGSQRRVVADVRNNAVLIYDDPDKHVIYQQLIEQLDQPSNLVEIDAIILDIDRNELSNLESRWSARAGGVGFGSSLLTSGSSTLFIQDFDRFFADIQALEGQGVASMIARPSVLTLENQPAVIDFSRTAYITTTGERVANIQPVTAGTSLQVIPRTIPGAGHNRFQLIVDIEDGQLEQNRGEATPTVKRGTVSTQAVVGENRSLVIGGFHVDERGDQDNKVPVLGSLPLIGPMFASTRREVSRRERLFILTPRLIGDQIDPARYVASENRAQLDQALAGGRQPGSASQRQAAIAATLTGLARGQVPVDVKKLSSGVPLQQLCKVGDNLRIERAQGQWYSTEDFTVAVGVVRNVGTRAENFNPGHCAGGRTLAVAAAPAARLQPGQSSEIFVVLKPDASTASPALPARVSMLPPEQVAQ
ncbi:type III secretion system outer membrane ring subunit SctC [Pseudomonas fluorescens]|uniref:Type 3 secretion system secretin n=1 Tax=Pseudomonas fluorescens TaxID=294 RepID=A0A944HD23_PSEFL|nr:type III secretion system outer membrane ring subunit SctC [Pseudomonas fluorescens]MBT2298551.1 type III secretion system outer membrane ring subunit SctC [Pseudomonas fluorescens]MBT2310076.1 type III secretion system outer membrane ring subunit SctC [Pseudomonas fluorescens]MBT2311100.1 type III secretion system outer membrane ring subunit SctC [Pseudomonas fluorescens]MBT2319965.1 type III secretion system outer membrane ring subunit SctC [Pseudomonas fluorescens]MBT2329007.1 type III s